MPNKISGADAMLKVLHEWGVTHIYGHPGGSLDSTMNALHNQQDKIKFIQVRHEEAGALAASASAKLTGKIGVVLGSAGPELFIFLMACTMQKLTMFQYSLLSHRSLQPK